MTNQVANASADGKQFLDPTVAGGDTLVIRAGSFALSATAGFNPALNDSTFTGPLFLADSNGLQISNVVPEPTTASLLALSLWWRHLFGVAEVEEAEVRFAGYK